MFRNGSNDSGNPNSKAKDCGLSSISLSKRASEATKDLVYASYQEKYSLRGLAHIFEVSHQSILRWTKKAEQVVAQVCSFTTTFFTSIEEEILELDELCSFVFCKHFKSWLWIVLCRRIR